MDLVRGFSVAVVAVVLGVTLLSGSVVDLTRDPVSVLEAGNGNATVTVDSVPLDSFVLRRASADSPQYYLDSDPGRVQVESVQGEPLLEYEVVIPDIGTSVRKYVLTDDSVGEKQIELFELTVGADNVDREAYEATVRIRIVGEETRTIYEQNTTVPVGG